MAKPKVKMSDLRAARHNSNFTDLLLDFIEERTGHDDYDDEVEQPPQQPTGDTDID